MKKLLAVCLIAVLAVTTFTACGKKEEKKKTEPETTTTVAETTTEETTTEASTTTSDAIKEAETVVNADGTVIPESVLDKALVGAVLDEEGEGLTVRQGPGVDFEGVVMVFDGMELEIQAVHDGWGYVELEEGSGWVKLEFVQMEDPEEEPAQEAPVEGEAAPIEPEGEAPVEGEAAPIEPEGETPVEGEGAEA